MQKNRKNSDKNQQKYCKKSVVRKQKELQNPIDRKKQPCYANCTSTPNTVNTPMKQEVRYGSFYGVYGGDRRGGADRRDSFGNVFKEVSG